MAPSESSVSPRTTVTTTTTNSPRSNSRGPDDFKTSYDHQQLLLHQQHQQSVGIIGSPRKNVLSNDNFGSRVDQLRVYQLQKQQQQCQQLVQLQLQDQLRQQQQQQQQQMRLRQQQEIALQELRNKRSFEHQLQLQLQQNNNQGYGLQQLRQHSYGVLHYGAVSQPGTAVAAASWWIADQNENILVQGSVAVQQLALTPIRVEYEALQHGVAAALDRNITHLLIRGTSDLIKSQFASGKIFPYFRTIYHTVRDMIPTIQNSLAQLVSCSFEVIPVDKNYYVKMLAENALSTHQRRQELAVFSLMNEVEVSSVGLAKSNNSNNNNSSSVPGSTSVNTSSSNPAPVVATAAFVPILALGSLVSDPISDTRFVPTPSQQIVANCSSSHTTYDSTYDSSVCDYPTASLWMSSDSVSPETSCYSRHSSPSLPSSSVINQSYPFPNINKQTASTTTSTTAATSVSSSAKSFGSDVQGNFLMFRIVH